MAFPNQTTFYFPTAANAGTSQWGTDVRKMLSSADAASDSTSTLTMGTGGTVTRTVDPYSASSADSDQTLFGWAITPTDMNSVSGARRFFPAGTHTAYVPMSTNSSLGGSVTLLVYVYRVSNAAGSRARTLLGSGSTTLSLGALNAVSEVAVDVVLPEVILDPDETIQYSMEVNGPGTAVVGRTNTVYTGTNGTAARVVTPGLKVLADTTGSSSGVGTVTGAASKVLGVVGASSGAGVASGVVGSTATTTGSSTGAAVASGVVSSVAGTVGTSSGAAAVTGVTGAIGSMTGAASGIAAASGVVGSIGSMVGSSAGAAVASGVVGSRGSMSGTAAGASVASGTASSVAGTVGSASGVATVTGLVSKVLGTVGTVDIGGGGGGTIIVTKNRFIPLDD